MYAALSPPQRCVPGPDSRPATPTSASGSPHSGADPAERTDPHGLPALPDATLDRRRIPRAELDDFARQALLAPLLDAGAPGEHPHFFEHLFDAASTSEAGNAAAVDRYMHRRAPLCHVLDVTRGQLRVATTGDDCVNLLQALPGCPPAKARAASAEHCPIESLLEPTLVAFSRLDRPDLILKMLRHVAVHHAHWSGGPLPDANTFARAIWVLHYAGHSRLASDLFEFVLEHGERFSPPLRPNARLYCAALTTYGWQGRQAEIRACLDRALAEPAESLAQLSFLPHTVALLRLGSLGRHDDAMAIFRRLLREGPRSNPPLQPDLFLCSRAIRMLLRAGRWHDALEVADYLRHQGPKQRPAIHPNTACFNDVLYVCGQLGDAARQRAWFHALLEEGPRHPQPAYPDFHTYRLLQAPRPAGVDPLQHQAALLRQCVQGHEGRPTSAVLDPHLGWNPRAGVLDLSPSALYLPHLRQHRDRVPDVPSQLVQSLVHCLRHRPDALLGADAPGIDRHTCFLVPWKGHRRLIAAIEEGLAEPGGLVICSRATGEPVDPAALQAPGHPELLWLRREPAAPTAAVAAAVPPASATH